MRHLLPIFLLLWLQYGFAQSVGFTYTPPSQCAPGTYQFTNTSVTGTYYYWTFGDGIDYIGTDTAHTYTQGGIYLVYLYAFDANWNLIETGFSYLNVYSSSGDFYMSDTVVCPGASVTFSNSDQASSWNWDIGGLSTSTAKTTSYTFNTVGTYTIQLRLGQGICNPDTITKQLVVADTLSSSTPIITGLSNAICPGENIYVGINPFQDFVEFEWNLGDGSGDSITTNRWIGHAYDTSGIYQIRVIVTNKCGVKDTLYGTQEVIDYIKPSVSISVNATTVCPGEKVFFNFFGYYALQYIEWDFGDGHSVVNTTGGVTTQIHAYDSLGNFTARLIVKNFCGVTDTSFVLINVVNTKQAFPVFYVSPSPGYSYQQVEFKMQNQSPKSWIWDFGDGTSQNFDRNATHYFPYAGVYNVKLIMTNQCGIQTVGQKNLTILNNPPLQLAHALIIPDKVTVCPGELVSFEAKNPNSPLIYWDLGDGTLDSLKETVTHAFDSVKTYTVTLVVKDAFGLVDVATQQIEVKSDLDVNAPLIKIEPYTKLICPSDEAGFYYIGNYHWSEWDLGDGYTDTLQPVTYHSYANTGSYDIRLIVANSCGSRDTAYNNIQVSDTLVPNLQFGTTHYLWEQSGTCPGELVEAYYWDSALPGVWDFGDGDIDTILAYGVKTYDSIGHYDVTLSVTNGCGNTATDHMPMDIGREGEYEGSFRIHPPYACMGDSFRFVPDKNPVKVLWNFGDGSIDSTHFTPRHAYPSLGNYMVTLISEDGCGNADTSYTYAIVAAGGQPEATIGLPSDTVFVNQPVQFQNWSSTSHYTYWSFGDSTTSNFVSPTHTYIKTGTYTVKLIVTNSCNYSADDERQITVIPSPDITGTVFNGGLSQTIGAGEVYVLPKASSGYQVPLDTTVIGPDGSFAFQGIAPGQYHFMAGPDPTTYPNHPAVYLSDQWQWQAAASVAIDGDRSGLEIIAHPVAALGGNIEVNGQIKEGTIFLNQQITIGQPMPNVNLTLFDQSTKQPVATAYSDALGRFTFNGLPSGSYQVYVNLPGIPTDTLFSLFLEESQPLQDTLLAIADSTLVWFSYLQYNAIPSLPATNIHLRIYPNPYSGFTTIHYLLDQTQTVHLRVRNTVGETVKELVHEQQAGGRYEYHFSAHQNGLPSGIYFVELKTNKSQIISKIVEVD